MHVVLLGDSIFDNAAYVQPGEPDVAQQLREKIDGKVTLAAVDGDRIGDVRRQMEKLPAGASHLVVSVGGNNLLGHTGILYRDADSVAEVVLQFAEILADFERQYQAMLAQVVAKGLPTTLCMIYNPQEANEVSRRLTTAVLRLFNDAILQAAVSAGVPVIDLRVVCATPEDFANPIEPSAVGGEKIPGAIARVLDAHDFEAGRTTIYT